MSVNETIDEYYRLKDSYYTKYNNSKHKILSSDDSLSTKRKKIKRIQMKCVNCKRNVGTVFQRVERMLIAKCGDKINPCDLGIQIKLGVYETINNLDNMIHNDLEVAKSKFIEIKLLLLFNLGEEDELMPRFEELKERYKSLISIKNLIEDTIKANNTVKVSSVEGTRDVERSILAEVNKVKLGNLISNFKELITNYETEDSRFSKDGIMNDAIDLYINQIIPTEKTIRESLYKIKTILKTGDKFVVKQFKNDIEKKLITLAEPEVVVVLAQDDDDSDKHGFD